jgi:hypothetical protein
VWPAPLGPAVRMGASVGSHGVAALPWPSAITCSGHPSVVADMSPPLLAGGMGKCHVHPCWVPTPTLATSRARRSARKQRTAPVKAVAPLALPTPSQGKRPFLHCVGEHTVALLSTRAAAQLAGWQRGAASFYTTPWDCIKTAAPTMPAKATTHKTNTTSSTRRRWCNGVP